MSYWPDPTATSEPYISETNAPIAYFTDDDTRKKAKPSTPAEYKSYWTRSPNATVANWLYTVNESGATYGFRSSSRINFVQRWNIESAIRYRSVIRFITNRRVYFYRFDQRFP